MSVPRGMALLVAGALFMEILDATIITPAVPLIASSFGVDAVDVNIAISAYLVTVAVLIPVSGWMADRFGTRTVFAVAIAVFTLASVGCAASVSLPMLVVMRVVQGVGGRVDGARGSPARVAVKCQGRLGAGHRMAYLARSRSSRARPNSRRSRRHRGILAVDLYRQHPARHYRIPVVAEADSRSRLSGRAPLDWQGLALMGAGIAAALIALESIRVAGTNWVHVALGGGVTVVLLGTAVWHLLRDRYPLIELRVLRVPTLRVTVSAGSLYRMVITAVPFLLPLQFQLAFGWTPLVAGLLVAALFVGNIAIKPATTPLMRRWGIRRVLLVNGVLVGVCFGLLACLSGHLPVALIAGVLFVSGALRSVGFTAYNTLAFSDVDSAQLTHASTLNAAVQELAAGLGVAVGALLLGVFTPVSHAVGQAYSWTYLTLGLLMMLTIVETLRLPKDAGAAVTRSAG